MPNPYAVVERIPWGAWEVPWERGLSDDEKPDRLGETEQVAQWLFDLGMVLWEVQADMSGPLHPTRYLPEPRWLGWALRWVEEAVPVEPPPRHHRARLRTWESRRDGVLFLLAGLEGMRHGLTVSSRAARDDTAEGEPGELWRP